MIERFKTPAIVAVLAAVAIALGRLLGWLTAPAGPIPEDEVRTLLDNLDRPALEGDVRAAPLRSAGFHANITEQAAWPAVLQEVDLAAAAGINRFIFAVNLPWNDDPTAQVQRLTELANRLPEATIWLEILLNPPMEWLDQHPDEVSTERIRGAAYPSIASKRWRDDATRAMDSLAQGLRETLPNTAISGVVLSALENGSWRRSRGTDHSPAITKRHQSWLADTYETPETLNANWGTEYGSFTEISPPAMNPSQDAFAASASERDFAAFLNAETANAIAFFADSARTAFGDSTTIFARYGSAFDFPEAASGQWAVAAVSESVDGFVLSPAAFDRGLGGTGGPEGPVTALAPRDTPWILLDDTRTGIRWNRTTDQLDKPMGFSTKTLAPIFDRTMADCYLLGGSIFWSDATGEGAFLDPDLWERFTTNARQIESHIASTSDTEVTLLVVTDERSQFAIAPGSAIHEHVLRAAHQAVRQAGVPYAYVSLDDLLDGRGPDARVLLFPNLYQLSDTRREALHAYLAEHGAAALWCYAPGAYDTPDTAQAVSATVAMNVKAFEAPHIGESEFSLAGTWLQEGARFGPRSEWSPLFYIEDPEADSLATFADAERASVAARFMESGWASVYIATPGLTTAVLREILGLLDQHPVVLESGRMEKELLVVRDEFVLVHAADRGDRVFDLGAEFDVRDMFDAQAAWPRKRVLTLPLESGQSRLLHLSPAEMPPLDDDITDAPEPDDPAPSQ